MGGQSPANVRENCGPKTKKGRRRAPEVLKGLRRVPEGSPKKRPAKVPEVSGTLRDLSGNLRDLSGTLRKPFDTLRNPSGIFRGPFGDPSGIFWGPFGDFSGICGESSGNFRGPFENPSGTLQDLSGTLRQPQLCVWRGVVEDFAALTSLSFGVRSPLSLRRHQTSAVNATPLPQLRAGFLHPGLLHNAEVWKPQPHVSFIVLCGRWCNSGAMYVRQKNESVPSTVSRTKIRRNT